jgi:hypothetical protein
MDQVWQTMYIKKTSFPHAKIANELPYWKLNYNKIFMQNIPI